MGDISPCSFILGRAFHHGRKPPFSWFVRVIAWARAIARVSCQGLCHVPENMIVALYGAMFTQFIRKEERDSLFSLENLFTLKLMVDVRKCFKNGYLQKVDKSNALVSCVYGIAHTTSSEVSSLKTPKADAFLDSMEFDGNGNLLSKVTINGPVTQFF